ncbi:hypothetical protein FXV77_20650 [Sphingobacterium phlebotomi]|uniref:Uncharacterized protein n=1 Tax=Sphingobacterium phlebotomi TaxID=2605433 RepID=A0A5D4GWW9_9SPHI|nr:hypothetical protein [Sphingobacterium phlebotomi]TYR31745.1 hypothetical protein FXV77_20650 [Sphingobacterium phlebotomi]
MLSCRQTIATLLFLLIGLTSFGQIYDRKLEDHKEKNKEAYFRLLPEIADQVSDSTLTIEQEYALFDPIVDFANRDGSTFIGLRKKYLQEVPQPPIGLVEIRLDTVQDSALIAMLGNPKFTTITLLQCYKPIEIGNLIHSLVQPNIYQATGIGIKEASISHTFGQQVFATNLKDDKWQIWVVNRAYALRFDLDLHTMVVSDLLYTVPNTPAYLQLQLPFIPYTQRFEMDALYQDINELRWNTYSIDLLRESDSYAWQDTVNRRLRTFYSQKKVRFSKVRNGILKNLETGAALEANWDELVDLSMEEKERLKEVLQLRIIQPDEAAYYLFSVTNGIFPFNEDINEIGKNAMCGFQHYIRSNKTDDTYKIQSKGYSIAFEYDWNIKTGDFSTIRVFRKK